MVETTNESALIGALLDSCCEHVLETMFFTSILESAASGEGLGLSRVSAQLSFRGKPSGAFEVDADPKVAQTLAASFLGVEESEVTGRQAEEVMIEFANMTCGSALSSLGQVKYFHLDTGIGRRTEAYQPTVDGVRRAYWLEGGSLAVCLRVNFENAAPMT